MKCPICGCTATRVNQTYWCPTCRIYLGENIAVVNPQRPAYEPLVPQHSHFSKMFDTFIWVLMGGPDSIQTTEYPELHGFNLAMIGIIMAAV